MVNITSYYTGKKLMINKINSKQNVQTIPSILIINIKTCIQNYFDRHV